VALALAAMTWQRQWAVLDARRGAVEPAGGLWVESAVCAIISEVLGAGLTVVVGLLWPLSTALATVTWL
jgi:hypothetical protein